MAVIDPIRNSLTNAVREICSLARTRAAEIPAPQKEHWKVETVGGTRRASLEKTADPDYNLYVGHHYDEFSSIGSFVDVVNKISQDVGLANSFLAPHGQAAPQLVFFIYILPIISNVLLSQDQGTEIGTAIDSQLSQLESLVSSSKYRVKAYAPLENFKFERDEAQVRGDVYLRRIRDDQLELYLNSLSWSSGFGFVPRIQDFEYQLERVQEYDRTSPYLPASWGDFWGMANGIVSGLRLLKAGGVKTAFVGATTLSPLGPGQNGYTSPDPERPKGETYVLAEADLPRLRELLEALEKLKEEKRFRLALDRFALPYRGD